MHDDAPISSNAGSQLLEKGLEEEVYTGTPDGDVVPLAARIVDYLGPGYTTEPDGRNVEFITAPHRGYDAVLDELLSKRCRLRRWLHARGYTLVPGGTLSLEVSDDFHFSKPDHPYHQFIAATYGTRVVTASTHINVGIPDPHARLRAYRVLRCEAAAFLALAACSPFLRGEVTGFHSTRWQLFPQTPDRVPLFRNPSAYVAWVEAQIASGIMQNPRHLWVAVRPNGDDVPRHLNRLELRVCDRLSRPLTIAGVTALYEARVRQVLDDAELDPLRHRSEAELLDLIARNEAAVARSSLEATVVDWRSGREVQARAWIAGLLVEVQPSAARGGYAERLVGVERQLEEGNLAMQWLAQVRQGRTPRQVIQEAIRALAAIDRDYDPGCPDPEVT